MFWWTDYCDENRDRELKEPSSSFPDDHSRQEIIRKWRRRESWGMILAVLTYIIVLSSVAVVSGIDLLTQ
ncbi:hypothetical protein [Bifidobacterium sp. SO1]|uniref:hypothetical protein n=1 Tax=Bifidobacterium sp. SO1 TaxID=2809029 RepID=UPI001BDC4FD9|nr:hypothetical protein [Bifidobacterium sp. SO1]